MPLTTQTGLLPSLLDRLEAAGQPSSGAPWYGPAEIAPCSAISRSCSTPARPTRDSCDALPSGDLAAHLRAARLRLARHRLGRLQQALARDIEQSSRFEPRLKRGAACGSIRPTPTRPTHPLPIHGQLQIDPASTVELDATLELATGHYSVGPPRMTDTLSTTLRAGAPFFRQMPGVRPQYPAAAGRLLLEPDRSVDPHVERLIEAFALLAGRIRHKLDDEFPELTDALLGVLYPHYLAPIPSADRAVRARTRPTCCPTASSRGTLGCTRSSGRRGLPVSHLLSGQALAAEADRGPAASAAVSAWALAASRGRGGHSPAVANRRRSKIRWPAPQRSAALPGRQPR